VKKAIRSRHAEEIRRDIEFDLHDLMGDLISASKAAHSALRVSGMNLKYAHALRPDLDSIGQELRDASERFRKIQAGVETLAARVKEGKL